MELLNVYVTNLGKYNEGELIGKWLSLPCSEEELEETFKEIGINEEYEEYFITDYESNCGIKVDEYENITELCGQMQELEELVKNQNDENKVKAMLSELSFDIEEVIANWDNYDFIDGWTAEDYERDIVENCYNVDELMKGWLSNYITIDYEAMARDDDRIWETDEGVLFER